MSRLLVLPLLVLPVFALLHWLNVFARYRMATDEFVLSFIAAVYALAILVMLGFTRDWSWRGMGLLCTIAGDVLLYGQAGLVSFAREHGRHLRSSGVVLDAVRSLLLVGGVLVVVGLVQWGQAFRGRRRQTAGGDPREQIVALLERKIAGLEEENRALRAALNGGEA